MGDIYNGHNNCTLGVKTKNIEPREATLAEKIESAVFCLRVYQERLAALETASSKLPNDEVDYVSLKFLRDTVMNLKKHSEELVQQLWDVQEDVEMYPKAK